MTDIWNKRREKLEGDVVAATLALFEHTGSNAFKLRIPGTTPTVSIVVGDTAGAEHCMCAACKDGVLHASDCSVHNMPAEANGPCDCIVGAAFYED